MWIINYLIHRLIALVPVIIGVTILVFIISHAIPGEIGRAHV